LLFYTHLIPDLSRLFLFFNEYDIAAAQLPASTFLSNLGEKSIFIEDLKSPSYEEEDRAILESTLKFALPGDEDLHFETRGPMLLDREVRKGYIKLLSESFDLLSR